jgi:hypothetical protein
MGRTAGLGRTDDEGRHIYSILDLFRYSSNTDPDTSQQYTSRDLKVGPRDYFSIDGNHLLTKFDGKGQGDPGDWAPSIRGDSFAHVQRGVAELVTQTDLREMNVLGWNLRPGINNEATDGALSDVLPYPLSDGLSHPVVGPLKGGKIDVGDNTAGLVKTSDKGSAINLLTSATIFGGNVDIAGGSHLVSDKVENMGFARGNTRIGYTSSGNTTLTVDNAHNSHHTASPALLGHYIASSFVAGSDGGHGTRISVGSSAHEQPPHLTTPHHG